MANFCKQCSIDLGFGDEGDMAGITTKENEAEGLFCYVLCEDCGYIQVNNAGECISDCMKHHHIGKYP